jgi:MFS family permease
MDTPLRKRLFYGWVILGTAFVIIMLGIGLTFSLAVFLPPLQEAFSWGRSAISATALINWMAFGLFSFVFGALSDRIGTRAVVLLGGVLFGAGMALASRITEVWHLYLTFGLLGGVGLGAFYVPLNSTATRWFTARSGLAVAIVSTGNGLGILIMSPLARMLISAVGWRATFLLFGLLAWVICIPGALLIKNRPEEMGVTAYGGTPVEAGRRMTSGEALKSRPFWVIALTHFFCCAGHSGPLFHMVAHAMDLGIAKLAAATLLGWSGATSILGRLGTGLLADRYGGKITLVSLLSLQASMVAAYLVAHHLLPLYLVTSFFGIAYGGVMPLYALLTREYFGDKVMGTAYGAVFFISSVGMGLGSYAGGWIFDLLGSYHFLYVGSALLALAAVGLAANLRAPRLAPALGRP